MSKGRAFGVAACRAVLLLVVIAAGCREGEGRAAGSRTAIPREERRPTQPRSKRIGHAGPTALPLAAQAPAQGFLSLTTDHPCIVTVDGVEIGRLRRGSSDLFLLAPGRHLLEAVDTDSGRSWAKLVDVAERQRSEVSIRFVTAMEEEATGFKPELPGIEFVRIPAGEFSMGSNATHWPDGPRHIVRIGHPFEIAKSQITQAQWKRVIRRNPTQWELEGDDRAVVNVSWEETQEFLKRLNELDSHHLHRLPSEAEWEYACRAGSDRDSEPADEAARLGLGIRGAAGGTKRPNTWGLLDMRGVVSEWCQDWYEQDYYRRSPAVDPQGPSTGSAKVFRGGSFAISGEGMRLSARASFPITVRTEYIGFRVVRVSQ